MRIKAIQTGIFEENEDLLSFVLSHAKKEIAERSVLVVTSKIVALSEGRTEDYGDNNEKELKKIKLIREEAELAIETQLAWLTIKDGMLLASAGIDESNANGKLILLPKDSFRAASVLRKKIKEKLGLKDFGVLITDSRLMPLRKGALGVALGYAGFKGLRDYVGTKDIFGRKLMMSKTNIADSLATSAVLLMGEGKERQPLAIITGPPVAFTEKINRKELQIKPEMDIYAPFFKNLSKPHGKKNKKSKK